jgi:probable rRNA maturation factor
MSAPVVQLEIEYLVEIAATDKQRFVQAAEWIALRLGIKALQANISIVDDATIHELNREQLDHDWPTDVISFVFEACDDRVDGELIASLETAARMAPVMGWSEADELLLYVVHGLLHLAGMDDVSEPDRRRMRQAERDCLLALGVHQAAHHLERWDSI